MCGSVPGFMQEKDEVARRRRGQHPRLVEMPIMMVKWRKLLRCHWQTNSVKRW